MFDFDFNIDIPEIDIEFTIPMADNGFKNRYTGGKICKDLSSKKIKYANAQNLAKDIKLDFGFRYDCILAGNFIFGDFIEAFLVEHNVKCLHMVISTLSLDQNNVDSLYNLLDGKYIDKLDLIISDYFYAHERRSLIPYLIDKLDIDNRFQLAVAGSHTKICLIETFGGRKIIISGSANLRSSSNIEQIAIEENPDLHEFHFDYHNQIIEKYKLINKSIERHKSLRGQELWNVINPKNK